VYYGLDGESPGQVGVNTATPAASAIVDVTSTTQGFLPPRMTAAQRNAIGSPAAGLIIYNIDCNDINFYNGTSWVGLTGITAPVTNAATAITSTGFTANWTAVGGATNYLLDVSTSPSFGSFVAGYNGLNVGNVLTSVVTGLTCGTLYYYRVRAAASCGTSANSSIVGVTSGACCISNYNATSIPFAPICGSGTSVSLGDDQVSGAIPIGFNFSFYCTNYSNIYISSNGFLTFNGASASGCCSGAALPTATITNFIAGSLNDLYPSGAGSIQYFTSGTAPNRVFIVNYTGIPHCCGSGPPINTFQIALYESTNVIEIHSTTITDDGSTHTMGIQQGSGPNFTVVPGRSGTNFTAANEAWRFN